MQYRREIDGLRAVAVVPVILFHAGFTIFSGGYVGVDVFFVISGYLITGIIIHELEQNEFSILRFYERRARRILPALFFVMLCCIPFALLWMSPSQFNDFSKSIAAVVLFASNILFWRESGYFEAEAEEKPLLHTWSLAVEEQYYLLFPLFLILLWRFGRNRVFYMVLAVATFSLLLNELALRKTNISDGAVFFLAPTRAWELLAGSICAFIQYGKTQGSNNGLSALGLALIALAIFHYDETTPFPSLYALAPVVGTALIILFGAQGTWAARLLSTKPFVGIGLVSYSAYLWHQPLFAFARIRSIFAPEQGLMLVLAGASLGLAYLSWRFIEQPFRKSSGAVFPTQRAIFGSAAAVGSVFIGFGLYGHATDGMPGRYSEAMQNIDRHSGPVAAKCGQDQPGTCLIGTQGNTPNIAIFGDSHAMRYAYDLTSLFEEARITATYTAAPHCPPLMNFSTEDLSKNSRACKETTTKSIQAAIDDVNINTVILAAEWANYTTGYRHGTSVSAYTFAGNNNTDPKYNPIEFGKAFDFTIKRLVEADKNIIVVLPLPEYPFSVANTVFKSLNFGNDIQNLKIPLEKYNDRNGDVLKILSEYRGFIDFVDPISIFCDRKYCYPYSADLQPLYSDGNHLTIDGIKSITPLIMKKLTKLDALKQKTAAYSGL